MDSDAEAWGIPGVGDLKELGDWYKVGSRLVWC